ncbi:transposase [Vibrio parahaemolyticus]|nr:IS110 family transposase [Vibrio parahaemolyticus]EID0733642.1 transposase [Vibrio parahaemolyticus]ELA9417214.1 transposase [Vibrio parahaemolyticus]
MPRLKESGNLKGRATLSKVGPSIVRAKLFLAAVSASTYNPDIKAQKRKLLSVGKTKMQALGGAMDFVS